MRFLKYISVFLLPLILLSCSGVKSSWKNFRAHYNTYYNAEKSFNAGIQTVEEQPVEVNPEQPQRVHPAPPQVSENNFDNTIDKGAQILRKFPDSKWTDDALYLLGKSYYYKSDFFLAIEKFEELNQLTRNNRYRQESLVWKARSLLDLEQYLEGISFITNNIDADYVSGSYSAELKVLLAEHHSMLENWKQSADYLGDAMADLKDSKLKGRAFFLYGQVLERLERYGEAFFAYNNVASQFPDYDYVYWSKMKKAEVARKEGNLQPAISIYTAMSRDDKNISNLDRINYEISRTLEMRGEVERAEQMYNEILHDEAVSTSSNVKAKTYYRLGKIYSEQYENFNTAAAYFDSASSQNANIRFLESKFDAGELASAYGTYSDLKSEISRLDSLLWLGSLNAAELDSVLNDIREKKREKLNRQSKNRENSTNRLVNVNSGSQANNRITDSSLYGFLNYKSPRLKKESVNKFTALWGNRPLVDNWRRIEVVRSTGLANNETEAETLANRPEILSDDTDRQLNIDLGDIPGSTGEKEKYLEDLVNTKYRMGNLFLLTLNMPDSARTYFMDIVRTYPESSLVPQSMYSLFEINSEYGNEQRYNYWGNRILREYPNSRFAQKVSARMNGIAVEQEREESNSENLLAQFQSIEESSDSLSSYKAEQYRKLALANSSAEIAPYIYYRAIRSYVQLAKNNTDRDLYNRFINVNTNPDSAATDSLNTRLYPFYGSYWDSVRKTISEYDSLFAAKPLGEDIKTLKKYLDSDIRSSEALAGARSTEDHPVKPAKASTEKPGTLRACRDLGTNLEIVGGMANFLA
ncbi:MAG: tetratricopeptide repeat protein, partial [Candidatus Halalkalibacterium sp. M3_1C_030]